MTTQGGLLKGFGTMTADRSLYIGNVNSNITSDLLYELFLQAGPLEDVTVKGTFAFVTFEDEESVPYACTLFEGLTLHGTELIVRPKQNSKFSNMRIHSVPPFAHQFRRSKHDSPRSVSPCRNHYRESTEPVRYANRQQDFTPCFYLPSPGWHGFNSPEPNYSFRSEYHRNSPVPPFGLTPPGWACSPPTYPIVRSVERERFEERYRPSRLPRGAGLRDRSPPHYHEDYKHKTSFEKRYR
ncbi:unnamed protein product [Heterobilharzia americana]|nr:unnamed protein product [Heterobilharzia americana]